MRDIMNICADRIEARGVVLTFLALCLMLVSCARQTYAQLMTVNPSGYKVLSGIGPSYSAGGFVSSAVIVGSTAYGTAIGGSVFPFGLIFKENLNGTGYEALHYFSAQQSSPSGLVLSGSTLVGVTAGGYDCGSVFKINLDGSGYATLADFTKQSAEYPSNLVASNGVVYGTTADGTSASGGSIFKANLDGTGYAVIYTFDAASTEIDYPANLIVSGSTLYGTRQYGGTGKYGTVFKVGTDGTGYATLHNFSGTDGALPSFLILSGTTLYGVADAGGSSGPVISASLTLIGGTIFKMNSDGTGFALLHSFVGQNMNGTDCTGLVLSGNTLYGCSKNGGPLNQGNAFSVNTDGTGFANLYNFDTAYYAGASPVTLALAGSILYGIANFSGANSQSVSFSLPTTGSINSWTASHLAAAPDGTTRIVWVRDDEAVMIWTLDKNGVVTHQSPVYGPYTDVYGTWKPKRLVVANDETLRLLWARTDYAMGVWSLDTNGTVIKIGPTYGPYGNYPLPNFWYPISFAVAPDGTSRVLWGRIDGAMGVWTLDANGMQTHVGPVYGPYYENGLGGWYPLGIGVANDATIHVAWYRSDNAVGSWALDTLGNLTQVGPTYGPYADAGGNWELLSTGGSGDGTSRLFWTRDDGAMGLWSLNASDTLSSVGHTYGPYADANGPWNAEDLSVPPDGTSHVLWTRGDRAAGVWSFDASGNETQIGPVYGPY